MNTAALSRLAFRAMGSEIAVTAEAAAGAALEETEAWFRGWERCASRFDPASELCNLNRASGWTQVSSTLWELLHVAVAAAEASDGVVTPTLLSEFEAAGYEGSFELLPSRPARRGRRTRRERSPGGQ